MNPNMNLFLMCNRFLCYIYIRIVPNVMDFLYNFNGLNIVNAQPNK